jgi:cellulose synthase/poly-beta-1,6-N-acetylglucosamine synthase-like glycosyltransferase
VRASVLPRSAAAGFKAGALNYALERTDPKAEIMVAVIDSDYQVEPELAK